MSELKFSPVNGRVLVEVEKEEFSIGGVALPETRDEKPEVGTVIAIDKSEEHPMNVLLDEGTKIIFNKFAATQIKKSLVGNTEKKEYLIMTKDGILAVYN
jgi:chaperonin GroES